MRAAPDIYRISQCWGRILVRRTHNNAITFNDNRILQTHFIGDIYVGLTAICQFGLSFNLGRKLRWLFVSIYFFSPTLCDLHRNFHFFSFLFNIFW